MKRKRIVILCAAAALVLCAALWYTRPVSLSSFVPSPQTMHIVLLRYDEAGESQCRSLQLQSGSDDDLMEQLADISFHRSLLNPVRSLIKEAVYGKPIQPGEQDYLIRLQGDDRSAALQFSSGSWSYAVGDRYLPCTPAEENVGAEVVDALWEKAAPVEPAEIN